MCLKHTVNQRKQESRSLLPLPSSLLGRMAGQSYFLGACGTASDGQEHLESPDILQSGLECNISLNLLGLLLGERMGVWGGGQDWGKVVNGGSEGNETEKKLHRGSQNAGAFRATTSERCPD